ncbi:MAG TPA: hypothetical protein VNL91_01715, partial [Thermoanaerobaculia bacterium]|nr:hypothetical protein [Thermoanaerobaculia bacterium]
AATAPPPAATAPPPPPPPPVAAQPPAAAPFEVPFEDAGGDAEEDPFGSVAVEPAAVSLAAGGPFAETVRDPVAERQETEEMLGNARAVVRALESALAAARENEERLERALQRLTRS